MLVTGLAALDDAAGSDLSFLANEKYAHQLTATRAGAVIVDEDHADQSPTNTLVAANPYLSYARAATLLHPQTEETPGVHASAVIHPTASIDATAHIGPMCVIGEGAQIGPLVVIGPGCILGADVRIGQGTRLVARVTLCDATLVGERCLIHPGAVLGSDGFGLANDRGVWVRVPQLGRVIIGNDVDIGVNTAVDRGSLRDTVIEDGAKLDNLIQIAHNVRVGAHTAIAACSGIAGSTSVGRHCALGGATGIAGHLEIGDGVQFTGMSLVTRSFKEPGSYSGNLPALPTRAWRRMIGRLRHLEDLFQRVKRLESMLDARAKNTSGQAGD